MHEIETNPSSLVFFDGEFTSLDPETGELLSLALVKESGAALYLEIACDLEQAAPWVKEHVVPHLEGNPVSRTQAQARILEFFESEAGKDIFWVADKSTYDWIFWCKFWGSREAQPVRQRIDFASMLFAHGLDPRRDRLEMARELHISLEGFRYHHALDDTLLLKELYDRTLHPELRENREAIFGLQLPRPDRTTEVGQREPS